ncbi:response regulator [Hydrogenophaga sp. PAMC20947]|uniref:response regulator n=1 Tax=Hydrogenophaga sp. PAMC20947 TaxID=2565558 RepID=UPI00109E06F2|nr:response regulator [Hydrogenophaga sp. PAMC20947]QCB48488.1 tetratricopeptide repeat protein [Hydrogenophaga sp. PAMC20947]
MFASHNELQDARALVIESQPQSRAILAGQLREFGIGTVIQCGRLSDARLKLEMGTYDIVLCEQYFDGEPQTGQEFLDDLRRDQLLPFLTVFVMVTSDASYSMVVEAAESALDAFLVKPHTAAGLAERISYARNRKLALKDIFAALDAERLDEAYQLCQAHFTSRKPHGLYAARLGAELMLKKGRLAEAQALYESVMAAEPMPWAKLGVARAQLDAGQPQYAANTLASLLQSDPAYVDAHDIMGRAQFEQAQFQNALNSFRTATRLTPSSVSRLLRHGMMAYHAGEREEGVEQLDRASRIGLDSKLFDAQALVLLGFARQDNNDARGLSRCAEQLGHLQTRHPESERLQRLTDVMTALTALQTAETARALEEVRRMAKMALEPDFDFESAGHLLALMTRLAQRSIQLYEMDAAIDTLGLRFCTSRALSELLACFTEGRADFAKRIRAAHEEVLKTTGEAVSKSLNGDAGAAVRQLLEAGERTCNAKIIETAHQILDRHADAIELAPTLRRTVQTLRDRYRTTQLHPGLGEQAHTGRAAGGMSLPTGYRPRRLNGLLAAAATA